MYTLVLLAQFQRNTSRLIVDLSSPSNASVNDEISSKLSSLKYPTVDHLSALILQEGKGAFLVKADLKEAYRMIPIHPHDQPLLGVEWEGTVFSDMALPFGLLSAPKISQQLLMLYVTVDFSS